MRQQPLLSNSEGELHQLAAANQRPIMTCSSHAALMHERYDIVSRRFLFLHLAERCRDLRKGAHGRGVSLDPQGQKPPKLNLATYRPTLNTIAYIISRYIFEVSDTTAVLMIQPSEAPPVLSEPRPPMKRCRKPFPSLAALTNSHLSTPHRLSYHQSLLSKSSVLVSNSNIMTMMKSDTILTRSLLSGHHFGL